MEILKYPIKNRRLAIGHPIIDRFTNIRHYVFEIAQYPTRLTLFDL